MEHLLSEDRYLFHTKKGKAVCAPCPAVPLADTHCHLTCLSERSAACAVGRAALAGVRLIIMPVDAVDDFEGGDAAVQAADVSSFFSWLEGQLKDAQDLLKACVQAGNSLPAFSGSSKVMSLIGEVYVVAGVHPYNAERFLADGIIRRRLKELLADPLCIGVGEIGLDFGPYATSGKDAQLACFRAQLALACERNLPVELHIRDAKDDSEACAHRLAAESLQQIGIPSAGCDLHCFTGGPEIMQPFIDLGCHIAFGGAVTFKRSVEIRDSAIACPAELLLCETDSPYMAPVPLRGMQCEPAMVSLSARALADIREQAGVATSFDTYCNLWDNAHALFRV